MTEDVIEQEDDFDFSILSKMYNDDKKCKEIFINFFKANVTELKEIIEKIKTIKSELILKRLKELDLTTINTLSFARIQLILNYISQNSLIEYRIYINNRYIDSSIIPQEKITNKDFRSRLDSILKSLSSLIEIDYYINPELDTTEMIPIYFRFYETDERYIQLFIKDFLLLKSESVTLVKKIELINFKHDLTDDVKEVIFWVQTNGIKHQIKANDVIWQIYKKWFETSEFGKSLNENEQNPKENEKFTDFFQ